MPTNSTPVPRVPLGARQAQLLGGLLVGLLLYAVYFSNAFFDSDKQLFLGFGCACLIFLISKLPTGQRHPLRLVLILLAAFLAVRYMLWRTTDTLLYTGVADFVGMALLYLAETYGFVVYLLSLFVNVWPMETRHVPLPQDQSQWPSVDVLIPTYNESEEIIRITVTAALQIDYPHEKLRVYILDDGGTLAKRNHPESGMDAWRRHYALREMAQQLGAGYITRETNQKAKAGNINHALRQTSGELVLLLDCDHVPTRDILHNTAGHFIADPKLFLAQTPHFFVNPAPIEQSLTGVGDPSTESDLFYRRIHPSMNFWNASYFCGSAAVLRRTCLMEVGGICGATITEDAETAFHLHSRGYNSVYINKPMVCGLSPESYDDYVSQHSRWAQGMVQLLLLNNPLRMKGLAWPQRLAYFNACFFWMFSLPRFVYFISPAAYLIFDLSIYHASWLQILVYTVPYILTLHMLMDYFYTGTRQPLFSEIYEAVQSIFLIPAVASVVLNPWNPSFHVTPKGKLNTQDHLSPVSAPFFMIIAINALAFVFAVLKWNAYPTARDVILVTAVWCAFNMFMALLALGAFWEKKQIRKSYRIGASGQAAIRVYRTGQIVPAEVRDVSMSGIAFSVAASWVLHHDERVRIDVSDSYGKAYSFESDIRRMGHIGDKLVCGSEFVPARVSYADVVAYVYGDSQRWMDVWNRKSQAHGTGRMLWYFIKMGLYAIQTSALHVAVDWLRRTGRQSVRLLTTSALRDTLMTAGSWGVYYTYLTLASMVEALDHKQARKLRRTPAQGLAEIYFPRLNATVQGNLLDVSLTGLGILVTLPFPLERREQVFVKARGRDGQEVRLECEIERCIARDGKQLCGAEFMTDVFNYPQIVRFVHGDSWQMIRQTPQLGAGLMVHVLSDLSSPLRRLVKAASPPP